MNWQSTSHITPDTHLVNILFCGYRVLNIRGKRVVLPPKYSLGSIEYGKMVSGFDPSINIRYFCPLISPKSAK